ncbi:hypothetical protein ACFX10_019440 [Malus domestica]
MRDIRSAPPTYDTSLNYSSASKPPWSILPATSPSSPSTSSSATPPTLPPGSTPSSPSSTISPSCPFHLGLSQKRLQRVESLLYRESSEDDLAEFKLVIRRSTNHDRVHNSVHLTDEQSTKRKKQKHGGFWTWLATSVLFRRFHHQIPQEPTYPSPPISLLYSKPATISKPKKKNASCGGSGSDASSGIALRSRFHLVSHTSRHKGRRFLGFWVSIQETQFEFGSGKVPEWGINALHFKPGGINSLIQVTNMKDMPKRELRFVSNQILSLFQEDYPEMVARKLLFDFMGSPLFMTGSRGELEENIGEIPSVYKREMINRAPCSGRERTSRAARVVRRPSRGASAAVQNHLKLLLLLSTTNAHTFIMQVPIF